MATIGASEAVHQKHFVSVLSCEGESCMKRYHPLFKAYAKYRAYLEKEKVKQNPDAESTRRIEGPAKEITSTQSTNSLASDTSCEDNIRQRKFHVESMDLPSCKSNYGCLYDSSSVDVTPVDSVESTTDSIDAYSDSISQHSSRAGFNGLFGSNDHSSSDAAKSDELPGSYSFRFNDDVADILTKWFLKHKENPYPSQDEKAALAEQAGLSYNQVSYWFTNKRKRHWTPVYKNRIRSPRDIFEFSLLDIHFAPEDDILPTKVEEVYRKMVGRKPGRSKGTNVKKATSVPTSLATRHSQRIVLQSRTEELTSDSESDGDGIEKVKRISKRGRQTSRIQNPQKRGRTSGLENSSYVHTDTTAKHKSNRTHPAR